MNTALLILISLVVISILILVHELGHFLIAKKLGVWVEEFGIGLPPRLLGKKIGETIYSVNALPLGGFVRLHGETGEEAVSLPERAFLNKPRWVRILISLAGIAMNFLLAIVCFSVIYSFTGIPRETNQVKVLEVATDSPAQIAGILVEDIILKVDKEEVKSTQEFISLIEQKKGKTVKLEVERMVQDETEIKTISLKPREEHPEDEGPLGITITSAEVFYPPAWQRPFYGIYYGFQEAFYLSGAVLQGFASLVTDVSTTGKVPEGVVGPVGVTALIAHVAGMGILPLLNFAGLISVNLAILNLVPFPPLDGSRILFIIGEAIFGKKMRPKIESAIYTIGMILLLILILFASIREIPKLIQAGSLSGFFETIINTQ